MDPSIFISYRRSETGGHAGRIFDRLTGWYDEEEIFYDVNTLDIGDVFPQHIKDAIQAANAVLVVIGPDWLTTINCRAKNNQRIDFVRREVAAAIARQSEGKSVVLPILVGDADMPSRQELHADLQEELGRLPDYNAHSFQGNQADWDNQFVQLREGLAKIEGIPKARFRLPPNVKQPWSVIEDLLSFHFRDPHDKLPALYSSLAERSSVAMVARSTIHGMGGVGKTQLALKYALDYRDRYVGVWWFRAESDTALQADMSKCCERIGVPVREGEHPGRILKQWLESHEGKWLLVFDNAEGPDALRSYLPRGAAHHVIVTSRNPAWGGVSTPLEVDVWTTEQSEKYLADRFSGGEPNEMRTLADFLGGLPLALEVASSYLDETRVTAREYLELIEAKGDVIGSTAGDEWSLATTLSLAFDKLSAGARLLLRLCAFAAPEPIPEWMFREAGDQLPSVLMEAVGDGLKWNRVVGELRRYGLAKRIQITSEENGHALVFHRVTQQVVRTRLAAAEDCRAFSVVLDSVCPNDPDHPDDWPRYEALVEHATQLIRFHKTCHLDISGVARLLSSVAVFLSQKGNHKDAHELLERVLEARRRVLGEEHPDTLMSMNNFAATLRAQGDHAGARELLERVLEARRRVLGEEHPDTLMSMNNLAATLRDQGDHSGARELLERVLDAYRRVLEEEHPDMLTSMGNLAATLRAQGDHTGARELEKRALEARRRVLGEEHPDTFKSMSNLATTLRAQGDHVGARELDDRVLEARRHVLGEEHPDTLTSMNNLATTLRAQGDHADARELEERALEARRRVFGKEHPDTLTSMSNLAVTLWAQGDHAGARELEEGVLEVRRRVLGEEHPDTLMSMNNLAVTLSEQGDHSGARELEERVVEARRRVLGEEHPDTLMSMSNLATTLRTQGDHAGARELEEGVLEVRRRVLGEEHPDTLTSMGNLAVTLSEQGDHAGARELEEGVLEVRRRVFGEEHPGTLTSMGNLAVTLRAQGDPVGARELLERVLEARRRVLGEEHPDTLTSMNNLAATLGAQGDHAGARELEEGALEVRRRVFGEEHPDTLTSMGNLAVTLSAQGDHAGARELLERVLEARRRVLGERRGDSQHD